MIPRDQKRVTLGLSGDMVHVQHALLACSDVIPNFIDMAQLVLNPPRGC